VLFKLEGEADARVEGRDQQFGATSGARIAG
jgi:hypothetical protein